MENFKTIEYHQTRDFSRKMNATFEFIRQNFKSLGKSILLIAGPPLLVASLILVTFFDDIFTLAKASVNNPGNSQMAETYFLSPTFWLQLLLMFILFIVSAVMAIATINNYIILYEERQSSSVDAVDVWARVRQTFWMYFGTAFIFFVLAVIVCLVLMIPIGIFALISPSLVFLGMLVFYCGLIYLATGASLTFFVRAYEKKGFVDALTRSFKLIQNKWWSTFGIVFVLYLLVIIISYIFLVPIYLYMFVSAMHDTSFNPLEQTTTLWVFIGFMMLYYFAQLILGALPNIGIAFQYFNLVELKEAKGLLGKIDSLGESQPPSSPEEQY